MSIFVGILSAWLMLIIGLIFRWTDQYLIADTFHVGGLLIMFLVLGVVINEHHSFLRKVNKDLRGMADKLQKGMEDANKGK